MRRLRAVTVIAVAVVALIAGTDRAAATVIPTNTSIRGAGYRSVPVGGVATATASFKVPSISCKNSNDFEPLYLGLFARDSGDLASMGAYLYASCNSGTKVYFGQVETESQNHQLSLAIGDTVVVKLTETGSTSTATLRNITAGTNVSIAKSDTKDKSVLIGVYGYPIVPTFTTIRMGKAIVNGTAIADADGVSRERLKYNSAIQITATTVTSGQSAFRLLFKNNN